MQLRVIQRAHLRHPVSRCSTGFRHAHTSAATQPARPRISYTQSAQNPVLPPLPELFNPNFLDELIPPSPQRKDANVQAVGRVNPMMDALHEFPHRAYTANGAQALDSTLSPTLDAFHKLTYYSTSAEMKTLLDNAWAENPNLTLRIIWNLRSIHEGKSEKMAFYRAFGWLYDNHPRTAISNLGLLVEPVCTKRDQERGLAHGYWKDLNILALATVDELSDFPKHTNFLHRLPVKGTRNETGLAIVDSDLLKPVIKAKRAALGAANYRRLERKLTGDPKYRALYVAVARLFSVRLLADFGRLLEADAATTMPEAREALLREISLAPKWAPSLRGAHDRHTNIATAISRLFYNARDAFPTFTFPSALKHLDRPALDSADATDIMRSFYRRWLLTPLRAASLVTERLMSANRWKEINYSRVSSVCMRNNKVHFFKHDPEGFQKYLISVEKGTRSISGATLLPHELVADVYNLSASCINPRVVKYPELQKHKQEMAASQIRIVEAQWRTLVQNLREAGTLDNALAVCDVSGSMGGLGHYAPGAVQPIFPAVALSLLLAQLAKPPFNGGFITFSAQPQFIRLDPAKSLYDTILAMNNADWGFNTDMEAVFLRLLLPLAVQNKVRQEDMIKRVFVFSDMQFDEGTAVADKAGTGGAGTWDTTHHRIVRAYVAAGYDVPEVVYWNLSNYDTVQVTAERKGVALMSGFSPAMLKVFICEEDSASTSALEPEQNQEGSGEAAQVQEKAKAEFNPLNVMKKTLANSSYDGLVVVD